MIDQPAPFDSAAATAARVARLREERERDAVSRLEETPVENTSTFGRWRIPSAPMTPTAAAAAFLHAAVLSEFERR